MSDAPQNASDGGRRTAATPLMSVEHLQVLFPVKAGLIIDRTVAHVHAVDDVSFTIARGRDARAWSASPAAARRR